MNFSEFKEQAIERQPVLFDTSLKHVKVESPTSVIVNSKRMRMSAEGLRKLADFVGVPQRFTYKLDRYLGEDNMVKILDALRSAVSNMDDRNVTLYFGKDSKNGVLNGISDQYPKISAEGYIELVERFIDRYKLTPVRGSVSASGMATIGTKAPNGEFQVGDFKNEFFETGPGFDLDMGRVTTMSYLERMICLNGMYAVVPVDMLETNLSSAKVVELFEYMDDLSKQGFVPLEFMETVQKAIKTVASVDEVQTVHDIIKSYSRIDDNPFNEQFVPLDNLFAEYSKLGFPVGDMTKRQKRNAVSDRSVWTVVNALTKFASHDQDSRYYSVDDAERDVLMKQANRILAKNRFDTENLIPQPDFAKN